MANIIHSVNDGDRYTVSELLANPTQFARPLIDFLVGWDLARVIFDDIGPNNGSVAYEKDPAPFAEHGIETIAEFAEYPATRAKGSEKIMVSAEKEGRWLDVSYEMRDENRVSQVNKNLIQFRNSAALSNARRLRQLLLASGIGSVAATASWKGDDAELLSDTNEAIEHIADAKVQGYADSEATYGFDPDTMIIPRSLAGSFVKDESTRAAYSGNLATDNPLFTGYRGVTKTGYNGLQIIIPKFWFSDRILVLDSSNKPGFISNTNPLALTGPYDDPKHDTIGYKLSQKRILAVDNPKAAAWITGVK